MNDEVLTKELFTLIRNYEYSTTTGFLIILLDLVGATIITSMYYQVMMFKQLIIIFSICFLLLILQPIYFYYDHKNFLKKYQKIRNIIEIKKNYKLLKYILNNGALFPPISVEKLQKYDFDSNFHKCNLYFIRKEHTKLIKELDIWIDNKIFLNDEIFYITYYENIDKINDLLSDIQDVIGKFQNLKLPQIQDYYVKNHKKYIDCRDLEKYYAHLISFIE